MDPEPEYIRRLPQLRLMKGALIALFIGFTMLVLLSFGMNLRSSNGTFDIHVHDTFFVLSYAGGVVFSLLVLGTFFSVGGMLGTFFRDRFFLISALVFLSVDTYYIVYFYKAFKVPDVIQTSKGEPSS